MFRCYGYAIRKSIWFGMVFDNSGSTFEFDPYTKKLCPPDFLIRSSNLVHLFSWTNLSALGLLLKMVDNINQISKSEYWKLWVAFQCIKTMYSSFTYAPLFALCYIKLFLRHYWWKLYYFSHAFFKYVIIFLFWCTD